MRTVQISSHAAGRALTGSAVGWWPWLMFGVALALTVGLISPVSPAQASQETEEQPVERASGSQQDFRSGNASVGLAGSRAASDPAEVRVVGQQRGAAPKKKIRRFFNRAVQFGMWDPKGSRYLVQGCGNRTLCPTEEKLIGQTGRRYGMKVVFPKRWVDKVGRRAVVEDRRVNSRGEATGAWEVRKRKKLTNTGLLNVRYRMRHGAHHVRLRLVGAGAAASESQSLDSPTAVGASRSVSSKSLKMLMVGANLVEFSFANSTKDELRITYPLWQEASASCGQSTSNPCSYNNGEFILPARVNKSTPSTVRMVFVNPVSSAGNWTVQETSCLGKCSTYYTDWSAGGDKRNPSCSTVSPAPSEAVVAGSRWQVSISNQAAGWGAQLTQVNGTMSCPFGILTNTEAWFAPGGGNLLEWIAIAAAAVIVGVIIVAAGPELVAVAAEATAEGLADATTDGLVDVAADDAASESTETVAEQVPQNVVEDGGETQVATIPSATYEAPAEEAEQLEEGEMEFDNDRYGNECRDGKVKLTGLRKTGKRGSSLVEDPVWVSPEKADLMMDKGFSFLITKSDGSVIVAKKGLRSVCNNA